MIDKEKITKSGSRAAHKKTARQQKENLRTLVENSSVSRVRSAGRIVKYGAASFRRNVWLSIAATLVMTITLIILLATIGASLVLSATAETVRQKIDITVYFAPGTPQSTLELMASEMRGENNVKSVEVSDSNAEFAAFLAEHADEPDLLAALADEEMKATMLSTIQATMRIKVYDPDDLDGVRYIVDNSTLFQANLDLEKQPTYDANSAAIATINSWANAAKNAGLILSAIFLVISILVIFNTIRMAIFSRREEIYMMKLVGADPNFIRGPFLVEAQICGIISGLLAATAAYFGFRAISSGLADNGIDIAFVANIMNSNQLVLLYLVVIAVGIVVGTVSARLAMSKYLK